MVKSLMPLLWIICSYCTAQQWPVQCNLQLNHPHTSWLPDLYSDMNISLELTDSSEPSLDVFLYFKIEGNGFRIETDPLSIQEWITLQPFTVTAADPDFLAYSLDPDQMIFTGISPGEYEEIRHFPEGEYTLCIQVRSYVHPDKVAVSNTLCETDWFVLAEPPRTALPECAGDIAATPLPEIHFSWDIFHTFTPGIIQPVNYLFELWEVFPDNLDPEWLVNAGVPYYSANVSAPDFTYTSVHPPLQEGRLYCWRVTLRDFNGSSLFANNGKSNVCTFRYTTEISVPLLLRPEAIPLSPRKALVRWNEYSFMTGYLLHVKKEGAGNWFEFHSDSGSHRLVNLEPATVYIARVKGYSENGETAWSEEVRFTTPSPPVYSCNSGFIPTLFPPETPAKNITPGTFLKIGAFELETSHITPGQQSGYYSGTGKVTVFFGFRLNVSFQTVFVNEDLEIRSGEVRALSSGINAWAGQWDYEDTWFYPGDADSVFTSNGHVYIISENGDTTLLQADYEGGLLITDQNGDQWLVHPDGTVVPVEGGSFLPLQTAPLSAYELEILARAMMYLSSTITAQSADSIRALCETGRQQVYSGIGQQRAVLGTTVPEEGDVVFITSVPIHPENASLSTLNNQLKTCEEDYLVQKILLHLPGELVEASSLNLFGTYLSVLGKKYSDWLKEQSGSADELARRVAEDGIKPLVRKVVRKKMK
ncbi:MAG: fibronectin type III domain-containing protein [Bacteroidia bacterium]|nr:fibronectin type III domain-containing protein [Bacteroidia bacterium]